MKVSVLTIVRGRQVHLLNQRRGLLRSVTKPAEWVVVGMGQDVSLPSDATLPIRTSRVDAEGSELPLAKARNHAASVARNDWLVFLDVDCIPDANLIDHFIASFCEDRLWMGNARYLPAGATSKKWNLSDLQRLAHQHPLQPVVEPGRAYPSDRYELFWSLCFAISRRAFDLIGGFDESFSGYGGEDTDFAFSAREAGVPFGFVGATAYHQHHTVCKPPLNHFEAIVQNARRFRDKWGVWPMGSWLSAFAEREMIAMDADRLAVLRTPTEFEIDSAKTGSFAGV